MTRVCITGMGGSIGCHVFRYILEETDWNIVGLDSFRHRGLQDRISYMIADIASRKPDAKKLIECWKRLTIYTHDLSAPLSNVLKKKIGSVDYIINLASLSDVQDSIENPDPFVFNNVQIAVNMLNYAREVKLKAFVHASTDEVYGPSGENEGHPEWSAIVPSNPYSASKACQEAIAIAYWRTYGVPLIITNTMNNFGELQQPRKYPAMLQKLITNNEMVKVHGNKDAIGSRFYLHSRHYASATIFILKNTTPHLHVDGFNDYPDRYNIVGSKRISNLELAQIIARLLGKELRYELVDFHQYSPGHDRHYGLDGKKLTKLGWKPDTDFETDLKQVLDWTARHPEWLDGGN
jgi:dTDP-glucose 4,6-dehydratase